MKSILILILLVIAADSMAETDLHDIQAPYSGGDSVSEVLSDMESEVKCLRAVDKMEFLSEDEAERADDQCFDQNYN